MCFRFQEGITQRRLRRMDPGTPVCWLMTASVKSRATDRLDGDEGASLELPTPSCIEFPLKGEATGGQEFPEAPCIGVVRTLGQVHPHKRQAVSSRFLCK